MRNGTVVTTLAKTWLKDLIMCILILTQDYPILPHGWQLSRHDSYCGIPVGVLELLQVGVRGQLGHTKIFASAQKDPRFRQKWSGSVERGGCSAEHTNGWEATTRFVDSTWDMPQLA